MAQRRAGESEAFPHELDAAKGLTLRRWGEDQLAALLEAIRLSLPELRQWLPWALEMPTVEVERDFLRRGEEAFESGAQMGFGVFETDGGELVGACGLARRAEAYVAEIGYWIRSDRTGRGYATAATKSVTNAGFTYLHEVERIEIRCDAANRASAAVARKLGYRLEGEFEMPASAPGHTGRGLLWAVTRQEWWVRTAVVGDG